MSRFAPDRRQAHCGPWPSTYWVGGPLKESRACRVQACTRPSTGSLVGPRPLQIGLEPTPVFDEA